MTEATVARLDYGLTAIADGKFFEDVRDVVFLPFFAGLVAKTWLGESLSASRFSGLVIGIFGVILLVWDKLAVGSGSFALAIAAATLGSFCYGFAAVMARKYLASVDPIGVTGGSVLAAAIVLSTAIIDFTSLLRRSRAFAVRIAVVVLAACALDDTPMDVYAEEIQVRPAIYIAAHGFSYKTPSGWDSFTTLAASAELEFVQETAPWNASLMAEYHVTDDLRFDGTLFAGASLGYRHKNWDLTGFWFSTQFPHQPSRATLMGRIRHQFAPGQKLGLEYKAYSEAMGRGELKLGYYGTISDNLTTKLRFGSTVGNGWQPLATLEVSWHVH